MTTAVAYYRTSSAANVGDDKDSRTRQAAAVTAYAFDRYKVVSAFYDAAVSGADPVDERPGFMELLAYCAENDVHTILVENASRFARDLMVQLTGHALLKKLGIELIPVDAPTYFTDPSPTAVLIQQILGAVSQFEKAAVVSKLKHARDRKREATGRCEGRPPAPDAVRRLAREMSAATPLRSLRSIARELYRLGHASPSGQEYSASSVKAMLRGPLDTVK
jgi:DNA invertase Pin-like site-specific DNA recombinase